MRGPGPSARATLGALALVAVAAVLFWERFDAAPPARGLLFPADLLNYYYPRGDAVARRLAAGELPLWNPSLCGGIPELATAQTAVLSPQTWLASRLPGGLALPLRIFAESLLGGAFMALFLRGLGLGALAAAAGGALYEATCLLGESFWPPMVSTLLWLPWLLLCIECLAQRWQWRWWLALVAGSALQILAGFPQLAVYSLQLAAVYALLRSVSLRGSAASASKACIGMAAAVILGAGVAGAQLLPTAELAGQSRRGAALSPEEVHYLGSTADLASALRSSVDPAPKLLAFDYGGGGNYAGIATLVLLAVGAVLGPSALVLPLLGLGALALLLSDGYRGPGAALYRLYAELPVVGAFRSPERLRLVTGVGVIVVACIGLDRLGRGGPSASPRRALAALGAAALAAATVAVLGAAGAAPRAALAWLLVGAATAARSRPAWVQAVRALLVALMLGDVFLATGAYGSLRSLPTAWTDRFHVLGHTVLDARGLAELQQRAGWQRVEVELAMPATGAGPLAGSDRLRCLEPLLPRAWQDLFAALPRQARATLYDVASVAWVVRPRRAQPDADEDMTRSYAAFQARYRAGADPAPDPPPGFRVEILANEGALPRAYWVAQAEVRGADEILAHVARGDFDFRRAVLLERDAGAAAADPAQAPLELRPARIVSHAPERVEIEVDAPGAGFLVLTDTWYPGWEASVDGRVSEILRANGLFRAVPVPAGASRVVFTYRPRSFRRGLALSAASLALAGALPLGAHAWRRRRDRSALR
jgi:hypothetical protein